MTWGKSSKEEEKAHFVVLNPIVDWWRHPARSKKEEKKKKRKKEKAEKSDLPVVDTGDSLLAQTDRDSLRCHAMNSLSFFFFYLIKPLIPSVCLTRQTGYFPSFCQSSECWESSTFALLLLLLCRRTEGIDPPRQPDSSHQPKIRQGTVKKEQCEQRRPSIVSRQSSVCAPRGCAPADFVGPSKSPLHAMSQCRQQVDLAVTGDPFPLPREYPCYFSVNSR